MLTPDQKRDYKRNRRLAYPDGYTEKHASESVQQAYETYSEHTAVSKESSDQYWTDYERTAGYPQVRVHTLSQQQHRTLTGSAAQAATDNHITVTTLIMTAQVQDRAQDLTTALQAPDQDLTTALQVQDRAQDLTTVLQVQDQDLTTALQVQDRAQDLTMALQVQDRAQDLTTALQVQDRARELDDKLM
ncbi:hypothetical protein E0Z10_g634 [Xylaria hypoxylon]|uniref:Uncharacterized protein n=1 Tax=Xylaria hypoxylon TaxID=37992 RepID=A0A4Z0YUP6_9PEZI|nr:hypothetical protein E0Z10_g634 [Xylaria hypoxylon]